MYFFYKKQKYIENHKDLNYLQYNLAAFERNNNKREKEDGHYYKEYRKITRSGLRFSADLICYMSTTGYKEEQKTFLVVHNCAWTQHTP